MKGKLYRFVAAAGALLAAPAGAQDAGTVQVLVHGVHDKGQVVYRYQVRNGSASAIDYLRLGLREPGKALPGHPWKQNPFLTQVPAAVPPEQCVAFQSMTCEVAVFQSPTLAEPDAVLVMRGAELQAPAASGFSAPELIKAGAQSTVAEVRVPARAEGYLKVPAIVGLFDMRPVDDRGRPVRELQVKLTRADTTPPAFTGSAASEKQGALLDVRVNLQVKDDMDPQPEVQLVSVTANQPLQARDVQASVGGDARRLQLRTARGRVYTVTYRAIDASENAAQLAIEVPAEPR